MDGYLLYLGVATLIVAMAVVVAMVMRRNITGKLKGPFGSGLDIDAKTDPPGVVANNIISVGGKIEATARTGGGVSAQGLTAAGDVKLLAETPSPKSDDPKQ